LLTATLSNLGSNGRLDDHARARRGRERFDFMPFTNNQSYQIFGSPGGEQHERAPDLAAQSADYLPYAGPVPQGSTYLHHAHILAKYRRCGLRVQLPLQPGRPTTTGIHGLALRKRLGLGAAR